MDFPDRVGPTIATRSPRCIPSETPRTASFALRRPLEVRVAEVPQLDDRDSVQGSVLVTALVTTPEPPRGGL